MSDILYHYCSTEAFESIVRHSSVRMSSLLMSNDTMEGKWLRRVLDELCEQTPEVRFRKDDLFTYADVVIDTTDGLGFCLSENDDMLSQWRGYANDARGFSIGFDKAVLEKHGAKLAEDDDRNFRLCKIEYDLEKQIEMLQPAFNDIVPLVELGHLRFVFQSLLETDEEYQKRLEAHNERRPEIFAKILALVAQLYEMKNPAFKEEAEHRLIRLVHNKAGGLEYRAAPDRMVPFTTVKLAKEDLPIRVVTIGPKNISSPDVIEGFLKSLGHKDVEVKRSTATYR